jgi:hypothetical protein
LSKERIKGRWKHKNTRKKKEKRRKKWGKDEKTEEKIKREK